VFRIHAVLIFRRYADVAVRADGVERGANLLKLELATGRHANKPVRTPDVALEPQQHHKYSIQPYSRPVRLGKSLPLCDSRIERLTACIWIGTHIVQPFWLFVIPAFSALPIWIVNALEDALTSLLPTAFSTDRLQERIGFIGARNHFIETVWHVLQISADNADDAALGTTLAEALDESLSPVFRYGVAEKEHPATLMPHEGLSHRHAARTWDIEPT
jgi:hypothetical protein